MTTSLKTLSLLASLTVAASSTFAASIVLTPGLVAESPQYYGGEFTANSATLSNGSYAASVRSGTGFETFCMAYDQEFSYGENLSYTLTDHTNDGPNNSSVPLAAGVAWLYSQFAQGAYASGFTGALDTQLQVAIWFLQQSPGVPSSIFNNITSNGYVVAALSQFNHSLPTAEAAAGSNNYGVSVILTKHANGTYSQPQLYYSASVPDQGTTVALLGLALLGLVGFRRRFVK